MQNPKSQGLDMLSIPKILRLMNEEDQRVPQTVRKVDAHTARAVRLMVNSLKEGGRIFFAGAGTSGRLGVIEAAECPPTFNTPPLLVQALMAGGRRAVFRSQEGAEDRIQEARREVKRRVRKEDVVIGISASGVTPFVEGALKEAKRKGASTILIACNWNSPLRSYVNVLIAPQTGPEIISGSTRLKAGTATKLILNRLTVATMVQLGKTYGNWMVDLVPRSKKLKARAIRILRQMADVTEEEAKRFLRQAKGRTKIAVLMAKRDLSYPDALRLLKKTNGFLRKSLE